MAFISESTAFDADSIRVPIVGIAADVGQHDSGLHQHNKGQLLYAPQGCMSFELEGSLCILPPTKAVWIPPYTRHRAFMTNVVAYRSVYFEPSEFTLPKTITTIEVNEVMKALINKMALWPWDLPAVKMNATATLFWEEFHQAKRHAFYLPLPKHKRLQGFNQQLSSGAYLAPSLTTLATQVGASTKTVTRIFKQETGMPYQDWRQQWRLLKAIEWLCEGGQVGDVAHRLAFSSDSAFIAFFKQHTGETPLSFTKQREL
ncbi:helix-turn-helix transcriptional regulator [Vibrio sp. ZSDZ65]|uniref:Helix-turn-helix transcriptional regulator n=1 Tax=Vibrio qingdaonensis TaxID=2829491 RepID=A0A9X3CPK5_9VIBR|nr:helix-turn-helix transcriptional regulator [Vibrio qingdaonensis]MCW8347217.1 helix-turn-helix transcriptional regulator [Vibrio qingdaonensis]